MRASTSHTPVTFDNILFATDLSSATESVLPCVTKVARLYGSMVHVVHVKTADWNDERRSQLKRVEESLAGIPHEVLIESGDVCATLLDLAARKGINLIVLGTHGRQGLERAILGSVAETVFRQAPCPVLTAGPQLCRFSATQPAKEILYATDLTPASAAATKYAFSVAQKNDARLTILTVLPDKRSDPIEAQREMTLALRRLEAFPAQPRLRCRSYCIVEQGDPAQKILDAAYEYDAELIVLGIRPHSIGMATRVSRRTAHEVVAAAPCPVLTVQGLEPAADLEVSPEKIEEVEVLAPGEPVFAGSGAIRGYSRWRRGN